jgi:hypothetical protein
MEDDVSSFLSEGKGKSHEELLKALDDDLKERYVSNRERERKKSCEIHHILFLLGD